MRVAGGRGASIIDVGGESGVTRLPPVPAAEEAERVVPLVIRILEELGADVTVSVDTYKPEVASAAVQAGARIVNDVSGLRHAGIAEVCARSGAALVITHTRAPPKVRRQEAGLYAADGVAAEVARFLAARMAAARENGVREEQLLVDPGPDFAKTPAQTVAALRGLDAVLDLGRPVLLALSRKDFIGAVLGRGPTGARRARWPRWPGGRTPAAMSSASRRGGGGRLPQGPRGPARRRRAAGRHRAARSAPPGLTVRRVTLCGALVTGR
jgi:dihydropteroate synthase